MFTRRAPSVAQCATLILQLYASSAKRACYGRIRTRSSTDPVNAALNYGYGFLEGECRRAINAVGPESSVGFLHDVSDYQTKQSLVYDLQEPFRWLIDQTVMQAFQSGVLDLPNFYFAGDDYRYRFDVEAKTRFLNLLREQFNSGVRYKGCVMKWDTLIQEKTSELAKYLSDRLHQIDFCVPGPVLERIDNRAVREIILSLTKDEARKRGIGKSTLHYLRKNALNASSLRIYANTRKKFNDIQTISKSQKETVN